MTPLDLTALAAALPPATQIVVSRSHRTHRDTLRIGNPPLLEIPDDAENIGAYLGVEQGDLATVEDWVAHAYFQMALRQRIDAGTARAQTLPAAWTPGMALP